MLCVSLATRCTVSISSQNKAYPNTDKYEKWAFHVSHSRLSLTCPLLSNPRLGIFEPTHKAYLTDFLLVHIAYHVIEKTVLPLCEYAKAIRTNLLRISVTHPIVVELFAALTDGCSIGRDVLEVSFHLDHKVPALSAVGAVGVNGGDVSGVDHRVQ